MNVKTIKLLAEYNKITNRKMNDFIKTLTNEQWTKKFGGFFNSIQLLCNHLYIGDFNWLKRFSKLREYTYIENNIFERNINFDEIVFNNIDEYVKMREILDNDITKFANEVTEDDLVKILEYTDSHGNKHRKNFGFLILHTFNHQTHHRGMISIYLEELGIENDYSNLSGIL